MPYADPDRSREYQREYRRARRAGDVCTTPSTTRLPAEFRLRTAASVLALIEEQVEAVREDKKARTLEKARCVGYLATILLKAIDAGDQAARLEAVEAVLKVRKNGKTAK